MRILQVVHDFLPRHQAGAELYTYHLAKALQARGHDLELCFTEYRGGHETGTGDGRVVPGTYEGLPFHEIAFSTFLPTLDAAYQVPAVHQAFQEVLAAVQPEIVHFQHLALFGPGAVVAAKQRGCGVVLTLHDYHLKCLHHGRLLLPDGNLCPGPRPEACADCALRLVNVRVFFDRTQWPPDRPRRIADGAAMVQRRQQAMQQAVAAADLLVAPSRFLREQMLDLVPEAKIVHHDYGFPALRAAPRRTAGRLRVGYLGTISDYKGVHVLVEAMRRLRLRDDLECRIWGDLSWFPEFVAGLRKDLPPNTGLMGSCAREDVPAVLAELDVLVVPSTWFENSPLTIHEAWQAGVPVVAADLGGMAELVQEGAGGWRFAPGDAADLARVLAQLGSQPAAVERLRGRLPAVQSIEADAAWIEARYLSLRRPTA